LRRDVRAGELIAADLGQLFRDEQLLDLARVAELLLKRVFAGDGLHRIAPDGVKKCDKNERIGKVQQGDLAAIDGKDDGRYLLADRPVRKTGALLRCHPDYVKRLSDCCGSGEE